MEKAGYEENHKKKMMGVEERRGKYLGKKKKLRKFTRLRLAEDAGQRLKCRNYTDPSCYLKRSKQTSGQDGSIGRHTVPPCTTKIRTTTNLKTKNNQD